MADETEEKARTPDQEDGEPREVAEDSGTPEKDERDVSREPDYKTLYLGAKDKIEEVNRLKAERDELRDRLEQSPVASGKEEPSEDDEAYWREVEAFAAKGDPVAKGLIHQRAREEKLVRAISDSGQLRDMPQDERQAVYTHYQKNRHRFGDPEAARADLRAKTLEAENKQLREQLDKAAKNGRPRQDVVRTESRDVPASEHKARIMTTAEFDQRVAALAREGRHKEKMALQNDLRLDKITLKD